MAKRTKGTITLEIEIDSSGHRDAEYYAEMAWKKISRIKCFRDSKTVSHALQYETTNPQKDEEAMELNDLKKVIKQGMPDDVTYHLVGRKNPMRVRVLFAVPGTAMDDKYRTGVHSSGAFACTITVSNGSMKIKGRFGILETDAELSMGDPQFFDKFKEFMQKVHEKFQMLRRKTHIGGQNG